MTDNASTLNGIVQAQLCPYTSDDEVDHGGLEENTEYFASFAASRDVDVAVLANGSTAESYANTDAEQRSVIETVVESSGDVPVIAGTGKPGTEATIEMTAHAERAGADAALVVTPYYRSPTESGLYAHFEAVSNAVDIDVVVYNNPDVSGAQIPPHVLDRIADLENVVATKDGTPLIGDFYAIARRLSPERMILLSSDAYTGYAAKAAMTDAVRGFFSVLANFAPQLEWELYNAVRRGDDGAIEAALSKQDAFWSFVGDVEARREPTTVLPEGWATNHLYLPVAKAAMDLTGLNGGHSRLPEVDLTDTEIEELESILRGMGVETVR